MVYVLIVNQPSLDQGQAVGWNSIKLGKMQPGLLHLTKVEVLTTQIQILNWMTLIQDPHEPFQMLPNKTISMSEHYQNAEQ